MTAPHPLDRPIWSTLASGWAALAEGGARARRLDPRYGPFGAAADNGAESLAALSDLVPKDGELWMVERDAAPAIPGTAIVRAALLVQMVAEAVGPAGRAVDFIELGDADAADMLELALMTKPGPFAARTNRLGYFTGIRERGRLVAMAGERMRTGRFAEVSGVCTHPDHRGRGYAGALMHMVASRMIAQGETPFLHSYADNATAIAMYEKMGFRTRATMAVTVVARASARARSGA